MKKELKPKQW